MQIKQQLKRIVEELEDRRYNYPSGLYSSYYQINDRYGAKIYRLHLMRRVITATRILKKYNAAPRIYKSTVINSEYFALFVEHARPLDSLCEDELDKHKGAVEALSFMIYDKYGKYMDFAHDLFYEDYCIGLQLRDDNVGITYDGRPVILDFS